MPTSKQCYQCGRENADQDFCGSCGSPLALSDYISKQVKNQLAGSIQNRDVLEMDSSIKVFTQAWSWIKLIFGIAVALLIATGAGVLWKATDFWSGVETAKQSVVHTAQTSSDEIARSKSQSIQDFSKAVVAGKAAIDTAASDAARQSQALKQTTIQTQADISRQTASLRSDIDGSRQQLQAASKLEPEMASLRKQLAQATSDMQAQQKAISSSEEFVKSVFSSHVTEYFILKLTPGAVRTIDVNKRFAIIPPPAKEARNTVVLMLLTSTPILGTLQLQQQVAVQPPGSFFNLHNLVVFFWGDAASGLETKPLSVSYFPDKSDPDIIHSLSEKDGRMFADDQPMPKFGEADPDFKGNKWMPVSAPAAKP